MTTAVEEPSQVSARIAELGREMVRLDGLIDVAREQRQWHTVGTLTAQRMSVQAHRSDLLVQQWKARHQMNWRYVG